MRTQIIIIIMRAHTHTHARTFKKPALFALFDQAF